jgi:haloalkane dehalogenase
MTPRPNLAGWPFAPRHYARPDGLALHYVDEGRGPPVVLVHGNPTWSFFYRRLLSGLAPDFRCLALDHLGLGYSARPPAHTYGFRLADRVADFTGWLDSLALKEPVRLVVHDWGGPIGLGWAGNAPGRVASLTVMNTALRRPPGYRPPGRLGLFRLAAPLGDLLARRLNWFARGTAFFGPARPLTPEARSGFLAPYGHPGERLALARFIEDIPLKPGHPSFALLRLFDQRFDELEKPLALIWGLRDFVFDRRIFQDWRLRRPGAEVLALPGAGHYLLEDEPDRILEFLRDFLKRHSPKTSP